MSFTDEQVRNLIGATAEHVDGDLVGTVEDVLVDDGSGEPAWVLVRRGVVRRHHHVVPLHHAQLGGDGTLLVPFTAEAVETCPDVTPTDGRLSAQDGRRLAEHYHLVPGAVEGSDGPEPSAEVTSPFQGAMIPNSALDAHRRIVASGAQTPVEDGREA